MAYYMDIRIYGVGENKTPACLPAFIITYETSSSIIDTKDILTVKTDEHGQTLIFVYILFTFRF